jgi:hypothetical protein
LENGRAKFVPFATLDLPHRAASPVTPALSA